MDQDMGLETHNAWRRAMALLTLAAHAEADVAAHRTVSHTEAFDAAEAGIRRAEADA